jgi:serine phosphatase RsbU (regulator of sigma subunit)/anti-sigma regulatory factor (Ser/Thr protein kinase)
MLTQIQNFWHSLTGRAIAVEQPDEVTVEEARPTEIKSPVEITPNDPLVAYFLSHPNTVEIDKLNFDSPALARLKESGVHIAVPLVSQGELIGLLSLGPRLSEQEYSADDRRLLDNLATQAAPALRVAQLARQQQAQAAERERIEQELRVARIIQQTLLPKEVPQLPGWCVEAYWMPARAVGGDFYDFIELPDGRMCVINADVTDKGVPAALVMASARSVLRAATERLQSPGAILRRVNETLCPDIPTNMFITCLIVIFDPTSGHIVFANAGHNLPLLHSKEGATELVARGMPLGLMPGMEYEEGEAALAPGDRLLMYSDGISEAHNPDREMFGFPRIRQSVIAHAGSGSIIENLKADLEAFTGPEWEQEDDVTFVLIEREASDLNAPAGQSSQADAERGHNPGPRLLAEFDVPSQPGNERLAIEQVSDAIGKLDVPAPQLERIKTAVGEATMNAMEHGNHYQADLPVTVRVLAEQANLIIQIMDQGEGQATLSPAEPDLDAKLAGDQSPRGWGLFLIQNMVDELSTHETASGHIIELVLHLEGGEHGR